MYILADSLFRKAHILLTRCLGLRFVLMSIGSIATCFSVFLAVITMLNSYFFENYKFLNRIQTECS